MNKAYFGKLIKTNELRKYMKDLAYLLPTMKIPEPPYELHLEWGFSSRGSDWDNPLKSTIDAISDKYKFNDNLIYKAVVEKMIVKKGQEYFKFEIKRYFPPTNN